jgi:hypothetical protein
VPGPAGAVIAALALVVGCGGKVAAPRPLVAGPAAPADRDREVVAILYRDGVLIRDRRWVTIGAAPLAFEVTLPDSVPPDDILVSPGVPSPRPAPPPPPPPPPTKRGPAPPPPAAVAAPLRDLLGAIDAEHAERSDGSVWIAPAGSGLTVRAPDLAIGGGTGPRLTARISAATPGRYPIDLVYVTDAMSWHASYALVAAGATGALHGAVVIDNRASVAPGPSQVAIVDDAMTRGVRDAVTAIVTPPAGEAATTIVLPGLVELGAGELAVDAVGGTRAVGVREVLVYDPIGARFDAAGRTPMQDESYGSAPPSPIVAEAVELTVAAGPTLAAGAVRLIERVAGGRLQLRGVGTLRTDVAGATTISVGRAPSVTGRRRRVDFSVDVRSKRLVEEFSVTLTNQGDRPAAVIVREHPYRGYQWHLAYASTDQVTKEAPQLLAFHAQVPAHGEAKIDYVVVYTW